MINLISLKEADELLLSLNKNKCPWCDGSSWVIRGVPESDPDSKEHVSGLRNIPPFKVYKEDDELKGDMKLSLHNAMPMIVARCDSCGFIYFFDYFKLTELFEAKIQQKVDNNNDTA